MIRIEDFPNMLLFLGHGLAAGAWLGLALIYLTVYRGKPPGPVRDRIRDVSMVAAGTLLVTGALITFQRLSITQLGWSYVVLLALKILMALLAFGLVRGLGPQWIPRPWAILILTVAIYILASLLRKIYQNWLATTGG